MHLIVGIDPGTTSAIAALDLRGEPVLTWSAKDAGAEGIIEQMRKTGKPSLLACDVFPVPERVSKIAAQFNVRVFSPGKAMSEREKEEIAAAAGMKFRNSHERDAFACSIKAYRAYANRLRQIDLLEETGGEEKDRLKDLVLNGYPLKNAILSIARQEEKPGSRAQMPKSVAEARQKDLAGEVAKLSSENSSLRKALEALERERSNLLHRLRLLENGVRERMMREGEVRRLRAECERLRSLLERIFSLRRRHQRQRGEERREKKRGDAKDEKAEQAHGEAPAGLNNLGGDIDLEQIVEEYRIERSSRNEGR